MVARDRRSSHPTLPSLVEKDGTVGTRTTFGANNYYLPLQPEIKTLGNVDPGRSKSRKRCPSGLEKKGEERGC